MKLEESGEFFGRTLAFHFQGVVPCIGSQLSPLFPGPSAPRTPNAQGRKGLEGSRPLPLGSSGTIQGSLLMIGSIILEFCSICVGPIESIEPASTRADGSRHISQRNRGEGVRESDERRERLEWWRARIWTRPQGGGNTGKQG